MAMKESAKKIIVGTELSAGKHAKALTVSRIT